MVVDQKLLKSQMLKNHIGSNVLNKISGQKATTPIQQPTPTVQQPIQQPTQQTQITNKTPVYDIKSMMGFSPQATKNQISTMTQFAQQQQANRPQANIQTFEPMTNNEGLTVHKTASFKDLVADLQNVANQGRNLEFMKFRDLYPEYVENWDKVVDLFESIKANPNYTTEQVTRTAQKTYPELFGNTDTRFSAYDRELGLKKLYDEMVSNQKSGQAKLTRQDIINNYPEFANTQDISTIEEIQDMIYDHKNLPTKKMPTYVDIAENFGDLFEGEDRLGQTMVNELNMLDNISETQYKALSNEGQEYVKSLANLKGMVDTIRKQYKIAEDVTDRDIINAIQEDMPELYNEIVTQTSLGGDDRYILENNRANDTKGQALARGIGGSLAKFGTKTLSRFERMGKNVVASTLDKIVSNKTGLSTKTLDKIISPSIDIALEDENVGNWGKTLEGKLEDTQRYNKIRLYDDEKFWDALKKGDWNAMLSKSGEAIGTSIPGIALAAVTGGGGAVAGLSFLPFASESAMEDIESDPNLSKLSREEKQLLALGMGTVESAIEGLSFEVVFPGLAGRTTSLLDRIGGQGFKKAMSNALVKGVTQTELGALSEGGEEVLQKFFGDLIAKGAGSDRDLGTAKEYWDIFTETFLSSQLLSAMGGAGEGYRQNQANRVNMQELEKVKGKILEGQVNTFDNYEDYNKAMKEVFPKVSDKELANTWNKIEQKKYDLALRDGQFYDKKTVELPTEKLSESDNIEYNNILDDMLNNGEITDEQRERVAKQLGITTLNNKSSEQQQGQMQSESLKPTGLSDITNKTEDNNTNNKKKVKAGVGTRMLQNYNRMNPKRIRKFEAQFKETYGQWMEERGFTKAGESNINDIIDYSKQMQKLKTQIIDKIAGEYRDIAISDMLSYATERASDTLDRENLKRLQPLLDKYESGKGLTFQEIEKMRKYFSNNINLPYYEDTDAKTAEKNMNVYTALQKYVENIADENGFDKLKEINAEISASESIARGVIEKILGADSNNPLGLTDRITIAGAVSAGSPGAIATVLVKNALKNENVRNAILRVAVGKRDNAKYRGVKIDLDNISKIADEKKRNQAFDEFMKKWKIDSEKLQNTLALPQYKPIAEVGENGPKINKPNTPQPTVKKDIVEINNTKPQTPSETEKKSEKKTDKAEQVQAKKKNNQNKIVDKNGKPKNVYHYSDTDFDTFDFSKMKNKLGAYFSPSSRPTSKLRKYKITANIDMKNPLTISPTNKSSQIYPELQPLRSDDDAFDAKFRELLKRDGYDGVIMLDDKGNVTQYVVLDPEQITVKNKQALQPENNGLAEMNIDKEAEAQVEGLAKINEQIAKEEQEKIDIEKAEVQELEEQAKAQEYFESQEGKTEQPKVEGLANVSKNWYEGTKERAMQERERLDNAGIKPVKTLPKGHKRSDEGSFTITTPGGLKLTFLPIGDDLYIKNWEQVWTKDVKNTVIENYKRFTANELTNFLNEDLTDGGGDAGSFITEAWRKLGLSLGFQQSILRPFITQQTEGSTTIEQGETETNKEEIETEDNRDAEQEQRGKDLISYLDTIDNPSLKTRNEKSLGRVVQYGPKIRKWYIHIEEQLKQGMIPTVEEVGKYPNGNPKYKYTMWDKVKYPKYIIGMNLDKAGYDYAMFLKNNGFEETNQQEQTTEEKTETQQQEGLAAISVKVEDGKIIKESETEQKSETVETPQEFEVLPADVSVYDESKTTGPKRISPDRGGWWQQLTPKEAIDKKIEQITKDRQRRTEQYDKKLDILNGYIEKFGDSISQNDRSKEATEARKTIRNEIINPYRLGSFFTAGALGQIKEVFERWKSQQNAEITDKNREDINRDYIQHVKEDISHGYRYPEAVLSYNPEFRTAVDSRARYEKGLYTSFSTEDTRIDYSQKDVLGAGMKRQDGKEITQEQKDEIVKGVMEFQEYMGVDMKQLAEDNNRVYVHLNGKNPFLMGSKMNIAGLYRGTVDSKGRSTASISLGGKESYQIKENGEIKKVEQKPVASHEIAHAIDYLNNGRLLDYDDTYYKLKSSYNKGNGSFAEYYSKKSEITARIIEEYVAVQKGDYRLFNTRGYWNEQLYHELVEPKVLEIKNKFFSKYKTRIGGDSVEQIKKDAVARGLAEISNQ